MVGENLQELGLPLCERPHSEPAGDDEADRLSVLEERDTDVRAAAMLLRTAPFVVRICLDIINLDAPPLKEYPPGQRAAASLEPYALPVVHERRLLREVPSVSDVAHNVALAPQDRRVIRLTQSHHLLHEGLKHRLQIRRRAAD